MSANTVVSLASSNAAASVTVPAGTTSATFTVTTDLVSGTTVVSITAAAGGATQSAALTITQAPPPASTTTDTVKVTLAEYDVANKVLNVQATCTSCSARLQAFVTSSAALIGTLTNKGGGQYQGQFNWSTNAQTSPSRAASVGQAA